MQAVLLFSGGRDSFLSACYLAESGYQVTLISFDNRCMSGLDNIKATAERLMRKYKNVEFAGMFDIYEKKRMFLREYLGSSFEDLAVKYKNLLPSQMSCLGCHTAMIVGALSYCLEHDIYCLADGGRASQGFVIELKAMTDRYHRLLGRYGIKYLLPVYDLTDDYERKLELAQRGFVPKVLEPQCWEGVLLKQDLLNSQIQSLCAYYDQNIDCIL